MRIAGRWSDRNLTRLELVISLLLIGIFIGTFSNHGLVTFARVERIMLNTTVVNIRTALRHRVQFARIAKDSDFHVNLTELNPMEDMQAIRLPANSADGEQSIDPIGTVYSVVDTPSNYIGELDHPVLDSLKKGAWYFDRTEKILVYLVRNSEYFVSDLAGVPRIRFKVIVNYDDLDDNSEYNPRTDRFLSVEFEDLDRYEWAIDN